MLAAASPETAAPFDQTTPAARVAAFVDRIKSSPDGQAGALLPLLSERHPVYRDRSTREALRLRGFAMAAFELTGLPHRALPYVLENLESSFHPYTVASAARALRGLDPPHVQIAPYLVKAIYNIWQGDNPVSFSSYEIEWPQETYSTALSELFETLAGFGGYARSVLPDLDHLVRFFSAELNDARLSELARVIDAIESDVRDLGEDCCELPFLLESSTEPQEIDGKRQVPPDLVIEDQDSRRLEWHEFFCRKPTVLAFFYTRCANPRKCTQTIYNLAAVQQGLEREGLAGKVRVAAVTYDPQFDTPEALRSFGDSRKFRFDADSRMFRVPDGFDQVVQAFGLGVNFTGSQVNGHRVELYLLDQTGNVARSFLRIQSEPKRVVAAARSIVPDGRAETPSRAHQQPGQNRPDHAASRWHARVRATASPALGLMVAFFPKCPMCWASYMSVLGVAGAEAVPYSPWWLPVIFGLLSANLWFQFRSAPRRNGFAPFILSLVGSVTLLLSAPAVGFPRGLLFPGFGLLVAGSLLQAASYASANKLKLFCFELQNRLFPKRING